MLRKQKQNLTNNTIENANTAQKTQKKNAKSLLSKKNNFYTFEKEWNHRKTPELRFELLKAQESFSDSFTADILVEVLDCLQTVKENIIQKHGTNAYSKGGAIEMFESEKETIVERFEKISR